MNGPFDEAWLARHAGPYEDIRRARELLRDPLDAEFERLVDDATQLVCGVVTVCPDHGDEPCEVRARYIGHSIRGGKQVDRFLSCDMHQMLLSDNPAEGEEYVWTEL